MKVITKIAIITIIMGCIALSFNVAFGNQTITYVERIRLGTTGAYYYKFNFAEYLQNLTLSISNTSTLTLQMPTRTWQTMTSIIDGEALGNNLALILDYLIMVINIIIYPLRIGAYILKNLTAIIGINQDTTNQYNGMAWLVNLLEWLIARVAIPYI